MNIYQVGGAVRDALLGLSVHDYDWVVVGGTPEKMLAEGFKPVGRVFPVFLHPKTHEEYALARVERKAGVGHTGFECYFAPDVTLEEDLSRRDLTINAMALDEHGVLIDPYGGQRDLKAGILRHVSPAFEEDPLRVLRVARFAARFNFTVADETLVLLSRMVSDGLLQQLSAERIWAEWEKGLSASYPVRMLEVLRACGALKAVWPALDALFGQSGIWAGGKVSDLGVKLLEVWKIFQDQDQDQEQNQKHLRLEQREYTAGIARVDHLKMGLACHYPIALCTTFLHAADKARGEPSVGCAKILKRYAQHAKWPSALVDFQQHVYSTLEVLHSSSVKIPEQWVRLFEQLDGLRRPQQAQCVMEVLKGLFFELLDKMPELKHWCNSLIHMQGLFHALQSVTVHAWLDTIPPQQISERLFKERVQVVTSYLEVLGMDVKD